LLSAEITPSQYYRAIVAAHWTENRTPRT